MVNLSTSLVLASLASLTFASQPLTSPAVFSAGGENTQESQANPTASELRGVLYGEAEAGSAIAQYELAASLVSEDMLDLWMDYYPLREDSPKTAAVMREGILASHEGVLAAMRQGAHRLVDWTPAEDYSGPLAALGTGTPLRWLATLSVMAAESSLDRGDQAGAVDHLLDGMQLMADLATSKDSEHSYFPLACFTIVCHEALLPRGRQPGLLERIHGEERARLHVALNTLDQRLVSQRATMPASAEWSPVHSFSNDVLSNLRLTRMATEYGLGGTFGALEDPHGGELEISMDEGRIKLRYRGAEEMHQRRGYVTYLE